MVDPAGLTRLQATKPRFKTKKATDSPFISAVKEPNQKAARKKIEKVRKPKSYAKLKGNPPRPLQTTPRMPGTPSGQSKKLGASRA